MKYLFNIIRAIFKMIKDIPNICSCTNNVHEHQPDRGQQHPLWKARRQQQDAVTEYRIHFIQRRQTEA